MLKMKHNKLSYVYLILYKSKQGNKNMQFLPNLFFSSNRTFLVYMVSAGPKQPFLGTLGPRGPNLDPGVRITPKMVAEVHGSPKAPKKCSLVTKIFWVETAYFCSLVCFYIRPRYYPGLLCQSLKFRKIASSDKNAVFQAPQFPFTFGIINQRQRLESKI